MPLHGPGELTVRTFRSGGPMARAVHEVGGAPDPARRITVFIHGFANDYEKASGSYDAMIQQLSGLEVNPPMLNDVWRFYWPGDRALPGVSQLSYPAQVGRARTAAERLAKYLVDLCARSRRRVEVAFVAHSLGSRILLETIRELESSGSSPLPRITSIVLMAAAVPERHCSPRGSLGARDRDRVEANLYSRNDTVLRLAFPAGQTAARDGFFPTAVGYSGNPLDRWGEAWSMGYGHGDYWKRPGSAYHVSKLFRQVPPRLPRVRDLLMQPLSEPRALPTKSLPRSGPTARRYRTVGA